MGEKIKKKKIKEIMLKKELKQMTIKNEILN